MIGLRRCQLSHPVLQLPIDGYPVRLLTVLIFVSVMLAPVFPATAEPEIVEVRMFEVSAEDAEAFMALQPGQMSAENFAETVAERNASTQGEITLDCGTAFFFIEDDGVLRAKQTWGFRNLAFPAYTYSWSYSTAGPNGFQRTDNGGGTLFARRAWEGTATYAVPAAGVYTGSANISAFGRIPNACIGGPFGRVW